MQRNFEVKVVILGDSGVGKSSILMRFVTNEWKESMESTMGAAFMSKMIVHNQNYIKFQVDVIPKPRFGTLLDKRSTNH